MVVSIYLYTSDAGRFHDVTGCVRVASAGIKINEAGKAIGHKCNDADSHNV